MEIERAAAASALSAGEKLSYSTSEQLPSLGSITIAGTGAFNTAPRSGQMNLTVSLPGLAALSSAAAGFSDLPLTLVSNASAFYIKLPSVLTSLLSIQGGKSWVGVGASDIASLAHSPEIASLLSDQSGGPANPAGYITEIEAAASSGVTKVGTATINGTPTTEYHASLDFAKLNAAVPAALRSALKSALAKANALIGGQPIPVDIWIDSHNLIRRFTLTANVNADGDEIPVSVTANVLAYGHQPVPTVPPASDVFSLTSLISSLESGGLSALAG